MWPRQPIRFLVEGPWDVVDLDLPNIDGVQQARQLRSDVVQRR